MNILSQQYPQLAKLLDNLSDTQLRQVGLAVSQFVVYKTGLQNSLISRALEDLKNHNSDNSNIEKLKTLSEQIEEPYLQAQEKGHTDTHLKEFRQARAVDALSYASAQPTKGSIARCIYEAVAATDANSIEHVITEELLNHRSSIISGLIQT